MVSSSQSSTLLSSSSVSTPERQLGMSAAYREIEAAGGFDNSPTSSEAESDALMFQIDLMCLLPVAAVVLHHGPALVHQFLLTQKTFR